MNCRHKLVAKLREGEREREREREREEGGGEEITIIWIHNFLKKKNK
jgi:hypothetical protein